MSAKPYRLHSNLSSDLCGTHVNRNKVCNFTFDGKNYTGFEGDTLASALFANGVRVVGRSFKYHRPRGVLCLGSEEPNALVEVGEKGTHSPNLRATEVNLYDGMVARSQNRWPSVDFDIGHVNDFLSPLFPAGFYYKTFMWPASLWMHYEHIIRRAAGLGTAPTTQDSAFYEHFHQHCDLLVIGGGVAGLVSAYAAAKSGSHVILVDEQAQLGGCSDYFNAQIDDLDHNLWIKMIISELRTLSNCTVLTNTTAVGLYMHRFALLNQIVSHTHQAEGFSPKARLWKVRAKNIILATGALERPLSFANNDRPGVMLSSALRGYLRRYDVVAGQAGAIFTNNDNAYETAFILKEAGVNIKAVIDLRKQIPHVLRKRAESLNIEVFSGYAIVDVKTVSMGKKIDHISIARILQSGRISQLSSLNVDFVGMSGGFNPAVHLFCHVGGKVQFDKKINSFKPKNDIPHITSVGACNGVFSLNNIIKEAFNTGENVAMQASLYKKVTLKKPKKIEASTNSTLAKQWFIPSIRKYNDGAKHFLDFQNDVTIRDIELAVREGYESVEHTKRYTTMGMATDQGKIGNINALGILADSLDIDIEKSLTTTFRPPFTPLPFGTIAGTKAKTLFQAIRQTDIAHWHEKNTIDFEPVGQWRRPYTYRQAHQSRFDSIQEEVKNVRENVGLLDASTLGKIDIKGPDAVTFLNRIYSNSFSNLKVGRCRYGLMLNDNGFIIDDGVTAKLADNHYIVHTTSGGADSIAAMMEFWLQTEWRDLRVFITPVTDQYAQIVIAGPKSRDVLNACSSDIRFGADDFAYMDVKQGHLNGVPARVYRISFSGELSYEIAVPAAYGLSLWNTLLECGRSYDIKPYGTEALHILRAEKGYIVVGDETDGTVIPKDVGLGSMVSKKKPDFIGKHSLLLMDDLNRDNRKQLVGLFTEDPNEVLPDGVHAVNEVKKAPPMKMIGHVTSSYFSPTLKRSIAMALIENGRKRMGERIAFPFDDKIVHARIVDHIFYDKKGERQNV